MFFINTSTLILAFFTRVCQHFSMLTYAFLYFL